MPLYRYALRRLLFSIPLLFGILLTAFVIANLVPADPVSANLSRSAMSNPEIVAAFRVEWGLDRPLSEQFLTYVRNLLQGNLGRSIKTRNAIAEDIRQYLPATIELATTSILVGVAVGIALGVLAAARRERLPDHVIRGVSLVGISFPVFALALVSLTVFHARLGWAAGPGRLDFALRPPPAVTGFFTIDSLLAGQWDTFRNAVAHLVLPSLVLGSYVAGILTRVTRSAMLDVLNADYMRTARAKGLRERAVILRHGLSNALIPVVTVVGLSYGNLLGGAVLTESIFAWPGIGRYMFRASTAQDFPAIMGVSILIAVIYLVVNFVVDLLYYFLDPRIRVA